jgi:hypothetical protein
MKMALDPLVGLILRLAVAVLVFFLITYWPVPEILAHLGIAVPQLILWIVGFIFAVAIFLRGHFWIRGVL